MISSKAIVVCDGCVSGWVIGCRPSVRPKSSWESKSMWDDPIVAGVHRTREMLAAEYGFDLRAIFAELRKRQATLGARLVSPKKRAEPTARLDRGDFGSPGSTPVEAAPAS
jgi:hypothetical protein